MIPSLYTHFLILTNTPKHSASSEIPPWTISDSQSQNSHRFKISRSVLWCPTLQKPLTYSAGSPLRSSRSRFSSSKFGSSRWGGTIPFLQIIFWAPGYSGEPSLHFCRTNTSLGAISQSKLELSQCSFMDFLMHQKKPMLVLSIFAWWTHPNMYTCHSLCPRPRLPYQASGHSPT